MCVYFIYMYIYINVSPLTDFSLKASPAGEQSQTAQKLGKAEMACETMASNTVTKKSSEVNCMLHSSKK